MKKLAIVLVLVLMGVGLVTVWKSGSKKNTTTNTTSQTPTQATDSAKFNMEEIAASGSNYSCTFESGENQGTGIIYISANKFRADYTSQDGLLTHMTYDGDWYYAWGGGSPAFKIAASEVMNNGATQSAQQAIVAAVNTKTLSKLSCLPWTVDTTLLVPPSTTEFSDVTERFRELKAISKQQVEKK